MRKVSKVIKASLIDFSKLHLEDQALLEAAQLQRMKAQAPYSHYWVGAAVRSAKTGKIYVGCNVECVTATQTTHAEQAAIAAMIAAEGPDAKVRTVAIISGPEGKKIFFPDGIKGGERQFRDLPAPCGQCLQIIWEFCHDDPDVPFWSVTAEGEICRMTIGDAFPVRFGPQWFEDKAT